MGMEKVESIQRANQQQRLAEWSRRVVTFDTSVLSLSTSKNRGGTSDDYPMSLLFFGRGATHRLMAGLLLPAN